MFNQIQLFIINIFFNKLFYVEIFILKSKSKWQFKATVNSVVANVNSVVGFSAEIKKPHYWRRKVLKKSNPNFAEQKF